jgi:hypothetical protein
VDRLPANATFEKNANGSYTMFWPTGDPDQGEHLFQFNAVHESNSDLTDTLNVMVVVGDPALRKTLPRNMR